MSYVEKGALTRLREYAVLALAMTCAFGAHAQQPYPSKPITLIVQAAPGGSADLTARVLTQKLGESMNTAMIVINEPGAAGALAVQRLIRSKPDGYTLLMLGTKSAIAASSGKRPNIDLMRDLIPIGIVSAGELAVVVDEKSDIKQLSDLVKKIKTRPGAVTIGVGDVTGGIQHLGAELFKSAVQGDFLIVPYGSSSKLSIAVRSGEVDAAIELVPPVMGQIKNGELRALAVTGNKKFEELPNVPTIREAGVAKAELITNSFVAAPVNTPTAIVDKLSQEINRALAQPDLIERSRTRGSRVPDAVTPQQTKDALGVELVKWREIVSKAKVKLD